MNCLGKGLSVLFGTEMLSFGIQMVGKSNAGWSSANI